ncbi:unnamed protein product [Nesidiocoris tenuis]|uniref:Fas-binding factor 1 n=1 Tax=Nesidiocoris tenuis TaxID=355587 RepID=A0A6H5HH15_9HEMI|nr:unnamed protein product [Nesidiocoris tenuis]
MADKFPDDPLDALNFSIDDDELNFSPAKTIGKSRSAPSANIESNLDDILNVEAKSAPLDFARRRAGSGDWLGLKDPVDIFTSSDNSFKPKADQSPKLSEAKKIEGLPRARTAESASSVTTPTVRPGTAKLPAKKRSNILDDLFGDSTFMKSKEKPATPTASFGGNTDILAGNAKKDAKEDVSYLPSLSERRRLSEKKPSTPKMSTPSDWLFEAIPKTNEESSGPRASVSSPILKNPIKKLENADAKNEKHQKLPQEDVPTLDQGPVAQHTIDAPRTQEMTQMPVQQTTALPTVPSQQTAQIVQQPFILPANLLQPEALNPEVIEQLTTVHAQLGAAMMRHQQNLQAYMQAILSEACRVGLNRSDAVDGKRRQRVEDGSDDSAKSDVTTPEKIKRKKDSKLERLKMQDMILQEQEIEISKMKLQVSQLELKIANLEEVKRLEIESLKKTHGFEISAWETRFERAKETYEETVKEFEEKIVKLKKKIEELEKQHAERVEALQTERMSDLEKLGEFHRVALEQAASITLPQGGPFKLPLKIMQKPANEAELSERESALLEKERHAELLRQQLEQSKQLLDEAVEKEKIRKEEREREMRRVVTEAQLKEEMLAKEYDRKKSRMEALQSQIEQMREEVLKEQGDLTREKLVLASEKAKMEAMFNLERGTDGPQMAPLDLMRARAELEASLEAAREARDAADLERRRHVELRKSVEEAGWAQKDKELELEARERSLAQTAKEVDGRRSETAATLNEVQALREEIRAKQAEIQEQLRAIEAKEKVLAAERMEIARERVELEKKRSQLNVFLPDLEPEEELVVSAGRPSATYKDYIDPKALILKLKAEKDLHHFIPFQGKRL